MDAVEPMDDFLSFHLRDEFVLNYTDRPIKWGFDIGGGNSLGELIFIDKYSRRKEDGTKETWVEVCRRVVDGYYSILKDHCLTNRTPWNEAKASRSAQDAFERMFSFKWLPPGRGLWMMGTSFVNEKRNSASLQNCAMLSTEGMSSSNRRDSVAPFTRLMEMSMLGVGVGFDVLGANKLTIHEPDPREAPYRVVIEDSREGWFDSVGALLNGYFFNRPGAVFDYSLIRPAGAPIKGFGGVAAGPGPLIDLHKSIRSLFEGRTGEKVSSTDIVDIMNLIGKAVVAGNVRRSALLALGDSDDEAFLNLKNFEKNPERMGPDGWGWSSNNSVAAHVGGNYDHLVDRIVTNGEPGLVYLDLLRSHGRLADPVNNRDARIRGVNPCGEQGLESGEMCTLVETFPVHHDNLEDWQQTLKHAFMYAKAVTILPTHWPETNEIMQRNRRIGCGVSGSAQFVEQYGVVELKRWLDAGYSTVIAWDQEYSEWLGVRESIKRTTIKPSGSVSLVSGNTPGVHWPTGRGFYIRRVRYAANDPIVPLMMDAGYPVEPDIMDSKYTVVASLPTRGPDIRSEKEVSLWEKAHLAAVHQRHWSDNAVSATLTFREDEQDQVAAVMHAFDGQLKTMSFLPLSDAGAYAQLPYEQIEEGEWLRLRDGIKPLDWAKIYAGATRDAVGEKFCTTDRCEISV